MISPTLFKLTTVAGLRLTRRTIYFDLELEYVKEYNFDDSKPTYSTFIRNNMAASLTLVSDDEHVAFLSYWLNVVVSYSQSVQMQQQYYPLAVMLHKGH